MAPKHNKIYIDLVSSLLSVGTIQISVYLTITILKVNALKSIK